MDYGFVRVAACVPEVKIANVEFNSKQIISKIEEAEGKGVQIIVFPELCLTAYSCGDLFEQNILISKSEQCLKKIANFTTGKNIVVILGAPVLSNSQLFNVAVVIQNGEILGVVPKTYLPNYNEFYEKRWFASGDSVIEDKIWLCDKEVPFGTDLLFQSNDFKVCFATEVCADLWVPISPSSYHSIHGANLIFNLSASNEIVGKHKYRRDLVKFQSAKCIAGYIYTSVGAGESTTDLVFGGHSMIYENGIKLSESERFLQEGHMIISDIDIEKLSQDRQKITTFINQVKDKNYRRVNFTLKELEIDTLLRSLTKTPFIPSDEKEIDDVCNEIFSIQVSSLVQRLKFLNLTKVVLGISGGLDSTLALLVTVKAFERLKLNLNNILTITMPGFGTTKETRNNSINLCRALGTKLKEIDITEACLVHFNDIGHDKNIHNTMYENAQARERTQILMDIANQVGGIVIGTGDLSELALGWSTYNGDHMSMYNVNGGVPKTLIKYLVNWVAAKSEKDIIKDTLIKVLNTPISPELLPPTKDGEIAQKTEDIVGPYELHDFFLYYFKRYGFDPRKLMFLAKIAFKGEYSEQEIKRWLKVFLKRFFQSQFKRSCMPDGPKVGTVSLSPRGDWRMASDADFTTWLEELD